MAKSFAARPKRPGRSAIESIVDISCFSGGLPMERRLPARFLSMRMCLPVTTYVRRPSQQGEVCGTCSSQNLLA